MARINLGYVDGKRRRKCIYAGTRKEAQEEMLGLKWDCVDLDAGTLAIRRTVFTLPGQGFVWSEPKSASSNRRITLTPLAVSAMRAHRVRQLEARLLSGAAWDDQDLVFPNTCGGPINVTNLTRRSFKPLLEKAGVPKVRFHDLRHSAASLLLSQGAHPKVVQELLGHSAIGITIDTYSHAMPTLQQEAVNKLGALLDTGTDG